MIRFLFLGLALVFAGCATSSVIPTGPQTYQVSASGAGAGTEWVREAVYKKANKFCEDRGLVMMPVSFDAERGVAGMTVPTAELTFRALPPGDPEIKRPSTPSSIQQIQMR